MLARFCLANLAMATDCPASWMCGGGEAPRVGLRAPGVPKRLTILIYVAPPGGGDRKLIGSVVKSVVAIVKNSLLDLACVFVDPQIVLFAILDHIKLVIGAVPVGVDIGNEVALRTHLLGAL